jgi:hypothetical protein
MAQYTPDQLFKFASTLDVAVAICETHGIERSAIGGDMIARGLAILLNLEIDDARERVSDMIENLKTQIEGRIH